MFIPLPSFIFLEIENTFKSVTGVESVIRHLYFECSGEDSINYLNNIRLSDLNHDIEVLFKENGKFTTPSSLEFFNFSFEVNFLDNVGYLEHLLNMTRTNIQKLQWKSFEATEQNDLPSFKIRESVTIFLQILRTYHQHLK